LWPHITPRQKSLVQLQYLYLVYLIPIGVMQYRYGCNVQFKVLHGPKNDKSLCNTIMGVVSLKIGLMEYVLSCPEGIA
jgi:hypothetical protein